MQAAVWEHQMPEQRWQHLHANPGEDLPPGSWATERARSSAQYIGDLAVATADSQHDHTYAHSDAQLIGLSPAPAPDPTPPPRGHGWKVFGLGAIVAIILQFVIGWLTVSPVWERFFGRFVWNRGAPEAPPPDPPAYKDDSKSTALVLYSDSAESVEWVNMCWRKVGHAAPLCLSIMCLKSGTGRLLQSPRS